MFQELLAEIDGYYGPAARQEFFGKMVEGGYGPLFALPLMEGDRQGALVPVPVERIRGRNLAGFSIKNKSAQPASLTARVDFSDCKDLKSLFDAFSCVTHNVITLGDFRVSPSYYARVFSDSSYFLFHGDGFCSSLAFLFQGLAKKILGVDVDLSYCRTADGGYTHVYGRSGSLFVDPALKSFYPMADLRNRPPYAWFYTLLKRVGMMEWTRIPESDRMWLFSEAVRRNMDFMDSGNFQRVYRPDARLSDVFEVFLDTVENRSEPISVALDDFPWKRGYRDEALRYGNRQDLFFLSRLERPVEIELPPGATLDLLDPARARPLFRSLMKVFYGRVFARLSVRAAGDGGISLRLPDLPWLIEDATGSLTELQLNSETARFHKTELAPESGFIGLERIEALVKSGAGSYELDLRVSPGAEICAYLPLNALLWNSSYLELRNSRNAGSLRAEAILV